MTERDIRLLSDGALYAALLLALWDESITETSAGRLWDEERAWGCVDRLIKRRPSLTLRLSGDYEWAADFYTDYRAPSHWREIVSIEHENRARVLGEACLLAEIRMREEEARER